MDWPQACEYVISLCRAAINDEVSDIDAGVVDLDEVYAFASAHMISAVVAAALEKAGVEDERSGSIIARSLWKSAMFDDALSKVEAGLEERQIWYMPLKGAVLKHYYPEYGMREFVDYDILIDPSRADDVKEMMKSLGFTPERYTSSYHNAFYKAPILNFEMHTGLFSPRNGEKLYEYYRDIGNRLIGGRGYERHFTPEDFYLYFLAHEYKHYHSAGIGLRSLLDTYVYLKKESLDMGYVAQEAQKLGIADFEKQNRSLAMHLWGQGKLTPEDRRILDYILSSGSHGSLSHHVQNKIQEGGYSKWQYMLEHFLVPVNEKDSQYAVFAGMYPFFYRHKAFLWLLPFYRTFRAVISGRFRREAGALKRARTSSDRSGSGH